MQKLKNLDTVRELYSNQISFINDAKNINIINKG